MPRQPLSRDEFQTAFDAAAPRVAASAPPGLSREQFNQLVIDEIDRDDADGPSLLNRAIPTAMRIGGTVAGSTLGLLGGPFAPITVPLGGALGAGVGEVGAERYEQLTGQRDEINPTQVAVQAGLGAIPMGRVAGATIGQIAARRAIQGGGMGALSAGATEVAETGELPSVGQVAGGAVLGTLLGGGAGSLEGRALRRLGKLAEPVIERGPAGYLPSGPSYVGDDAGRIAPAGSDIPMAPAEDGSFARGVPAEYGARVVRGELPAPRRFVAAPGGGVRDVEAQHPTIDIIPGDAPRRQPVGLLPAGPRFAADASGRVAPVEQADELARVAQGSRPSESSVRGVPAAAVERDVDVTRPTGPTLPMETADAGAFRGRSGPDLEPPSAAVRAAPSLSKGAKIAEVDEGVRQLEALLERTGGSGARSVLGRGTLPASKPQPGGGGAPAAVDDFEKFAAMFDEVAGTPGGREPGEAGFARTGTLVRLGGAAGGAAFGATQGDTSQERIENALLYGAAGAAAPSLIAAAKRKPLVGTFVSREAAQAGAATPGRIVGDLVPRGARTVQGAAIRDPLAGMDAFLDKFAGSNPLLRDGIKERLIEHGGFANQRRGSLDVETLGDIAEQVRVDISRSLPRGTTLSAEGIVAYTRAVKTTMDRVRELSEVVSAGKATDEDIVKLAAAQADADVVLKSLMGARSEAGRALAQLRTFGALLETRNVNLYRQAASGLRDEAAQLAARVSQFRDPVEAYRFLQSQGRSTLSDRARSYFYSSILSGVKTHERNAIGNAASILTRFVSTPVAAGLDAAKAAATGRSREVFLGELQPAAVGAVAGFERGLQDFVFTLRHGVSPDAMRRSVTAAVEHGAFDLPRVEFEFGGGANPFNWPGRMLDAADTLFRSTARNMELYSSAWAQARKQGLRGDRLIARAAELRTDASLQTAAQKFAAESVFQQKPTGRIGKLQAFLKDLPGAYFVMPFIKTPVNILKTGVQASPAGFVTAAGRQGGRAGAQAQGMAALGTLLLAPLAWLAASNRLSGAGPRNATERAELMESGWRPNSVRIGDQWVEYSLFQPVSIQANVIANAYEAWRQAGAKEEPLEAMVWQVVTRSGRSLMEQSYLSGLYDFMRAIEEPEKFLETWQGRTAHSLTPFAGAQRTVTQATDPTIRDPETWREVVASNVPGLSTSVQPRLDRFGRDVQRAGGGRAAFDPFNTSPVVDDPVAAELTRLGVNVALPTDRIALPGGAKLTRAQSLELRRDKGQKVYQVIGRLIRNPNFQRLPDPMKVNAIEKVKRAASGEANDEVRARTVRDQRMQREALMQQLQEGQR